MDKRDLFEMFCEEYNIVYDFSRLGSSYRTYETQKAYLVFKFSSSFIREWEDVRQGLHPDTQAESGTLRKLEKTQ